MKLYHFTTVVALTKIHHEGIRKGVLPWSMNAAGQAGLVPGWQWLTANPDFGMEWAKRTPNRPFRLDDLRLTVTIPELGLKPGQFVKWTSLRDRHNPASREYLDEFEDHKDWYLFHGVIPPGWVGSIERNPWPDVPMLDGGN